MRKWHRWLSVVFGVFILCTAVTGLLSHATALWPTDVPRAELPAGFVCPERVRCRPAGPETGPRAWVGFFHHLHSGETFGPIGTALSIASGLALLFFAVSGVWLYVQMFRGRLVKARARGTTRGRRLFWS